MSEGNEKLSFDEKLLLIFYLVKAYIVAIAEALKRRR